MAAVRRMFRVCAIGRRMAFAAAAGLGIAVGTFSFGSNADVLRVALDKVEILRLEKPASVVLVGTPEIADVTVESPRLILLVGKKTGETNLLILNGQGETVYTFTLVVVPEIDRHVTVHRSSDGVSTLSCEPTCVAVKNPGLEGSESKPSKKSDAPSGDKAGAAESPPKGAPSGPAKTSSP